MKATVKEEQKEFRPITVEITFERDEDLYGVNGFVYRYDYCIEESHNFMSRDNTCKAIREALRKARY